MHMTLLYLSVLEFDGVGEKHGADVTGVGARDGYDRGLGQLLEDASVLLGARREERRRHRRHQISRLHLHVPGAAAGGH